MNYTLQRSPPLEPSALQALFDAAWPEHGDPGWERVLARSLGWVATRSDGRLIGFVNVATDGAEHAFLLDTVVLPTCRRQGVGRALVHEAAQMARDAGATWLHVDYAPDAARFYAACGFRSTAAGLLQLTTDPDRSREATASD